MKSGKCSVWVAALCGLAAAFAAPLCPAARAQGDAAPRFVPPAPNVIRLYLVVPLKFEDTLRQPLKPNSAYLNMFTDPRFGAEIFYRISSNYHLSIGGHLKPAPPAVPGQPAPAPAPVEPGPEGAAPATEGTAISEPIVLGKSSMAYLGTGDGTGGAWNQQLLVDDLVPLLEQTFDLSKFYGLALFPNTPDGPGLAISGKPLATRTGMAGRNPFPTLCLNPKNVSLSTLVREIGHQLNFGEPRVAGTPAAAPAGAAPAEGAPAEGEPKVDLSAMTFVGQSDSRLGTIPCDHIMWHKQQAGWTAPADVKVASAPVAGYVFRIFARSGTMTGLRLLKVPLQTEGEFLTLEAVLPTAIDGVSALKAYGVLAHFVREKGKPAGANVLPEQPEALLSPKGNLLFQRGETWASTGGEVTFKVERIAEEFCDVRVTVK